MTPSLDWLCTALGWTLSAFGLGLLAWALLWDRSRGRRRCPKCWYDMAGVAGLQCPECGRGSRRERSLYSTRRKPCIAAIAAVVALGGVAPRADDTHGSGLGVLRYVIERTLACFSHFRRLRLCYERWGSHFQAFHDLAAALLICSRLKSLDVAF